MITTMVIAKVAAIPIEIAINAISHLIHLGIKNSAPITQIVARHVLRYDCVSSRTVSMSAGITFSQSPTTP